MPRNLQENIAEMERRIAEICGVMRGPLSNLDRACYHADRKEMREQLACFKNELAELEKAGVTDAK